MKNVFTFLIISLISVSAFAYSDIQFSCGVVKNIGNGKLYRRLEPNMFGMNDKFVIRTKFVSGKSYKIYEGVNDLVVSDMSRKVVNTNFSFKHKFQEVKREAREMLKEAKDLEKDLYGCAGHIRIPLKYSGSHVYTSHDSLEDALDQFLRQVERHL